VEIRLDREEFAAIEHLGPIRWRRRAPLDRIAGFARLASVPRAEAGRPAPAPAALGDFTGLRVALRDRRPLTVAAFYPAAVAQDLESALRDELARVVPDKSLARPFEQVTVSQDAMPPSSWTTPGPSAAAARPPDTDIRCEVSRELGALLIDVPPRGLLRGSHGLFFFSLLWNAFVLAFIAVLVFGADRTDRGAFALLIPFFAVGVGLLLVSIRLGKARTMLVAMPDRLALRRRSPFGRSEKTFLAGQIADIRWGPSGTTVNDKPLMQLQLVHPDGRHTGLLTGRSTAELDWLAAELRQKLGLDGHDAPDAAE
jgi:hypothetical protein